MVMEDPKEDGCCDWDMNQEQTLKGYVHSATRKGPRVKEWKIGEKQGWTG